MARPPSAESIIKNLKRQQSESRTPIATEMFLPNHSGDHSKGRVRTTPTTDFEIANKKYVDDNAGFTLPSLTTGSVLFSNGSTIAQDNANLFWDDTLNRLGVGNATPTVDLDVTGVIRATTSVNSDVFAQHGSSSNANIAMSVNDTMTFDTGGSQAMHIDASQNVIVGNTTTADGLLNVFSGSAGTVTARVGGDDLVIEHNTNGGMSILTPDTNTSTIIFGSPTDPLGADIKWNHDNDVFIIGSRKTDASVRFVSGGGVTALNINKNQNFDFQAGNLTTTGTLSSGVATLGDSSQMATSAAPTTDADIANKKYVDDSSGALTDKTYLLIAGRVSQLDGVSLTLGL